MVLAPVALPGTIPSSVDVIEAVEVALSVSDAGPWDKPCFRDGLFSTVSLGEFMWVELMTLVS